MILSRPKEFTCAVSRETYLITEIDIREVKGRTNILATLLDGSRMMFDHHSNVPVLMALAEEDDPDFVSSVDRQSEYLKNALF